MQMLQRGPKRWKARLGCVARRLVENNQRMIIGLIEGVAACFHHLDYKRRPPRARIVRGSNTAEQLA